MPKGVGYGKMKRKAYLANMRRKDGFRKPGGLAKRPSRKSGRLERIGRVGKSILKKGVRGGLSVAKKHGLKLALGAGSKMLKG